MNRIFFSPDAALYGIPIEYAALPDNSLLNEKYSVFRVSSTRELALDRQPVKNRQVGIFGNIDYYNSAGNSPKLSNSALAINPEYGNYMDSTNNTRGASELESKVFPELTFSKEEIIGISNMAHSYDYTISMYEKDNASEEMFKGISGKSPEILVVSTHGYVVADSDTNSLIPVDNSEAEGMMKEDAHLSRAGLVFAGANRTLMEDPILGEEDGFVTARDITQMMLDDTDIVLLSACETGLGEISTEGIYGLQRGFKKAGVNSLLMSLWKVNDEATSILMKSFFKEYMMSGSKAEAMKNAIRFLRTVDDGRWDDPEYWAAFILLDALN